MVAKNMTLRKALMKNTGVRGANMDCHLNCDECHNSVMLNLQDLFPIARSCSDQDSKLSSDKQAVLHR
ncbi:hypothetical protein Selin_2040 [Desulfurispirillum indicum S5]|uniref:Uncharacterized protein n=1 Tax=Desulfurispirillum indicum (strain ATCC BAA-1389 / DSM 22839 / S5) TaxID=653733 RepID=E6W2T5_DESIS|nr:hypothetical protein Selin_2040 [Desulfurispirillum indicum S5]